MAFVFPGSAPPQDIPDSVVEEVQNPLMDSTNQASLSRRRVIAKHQQPSHQNDASTTTRTSNLFAPVYQSEILPTSHHNNFGNGCWLEYDCSNTLMDEETVHQELSKLQGSSYLRRKSDTIWLIHFNSLAFAEKYATYDSFQWASNQESLHNVARPATTISSKTAPNIWLHPSNSPPEEEEEEESSTKPPFWKVFLMWLVGVEEHPSRYVQSDH